MCVCVRVVVYVCARVVHAHVYPCECERAISVAVFPSGHVRGELIAVLAAIATQVALEGVAEAMAAHVDGVHDMVQEEHATVFTAVRPHLLPLAAQNLEGVGGQVQRCRPERLVLPLLLFHQGHRPIARPSCNVIGQIDEAGAPAWPLLVVALGVGGVLAAVAGRAVALAGRRPGVGQQQQVLGRAVFG